MIRRILLSIACFILCIFGVLPTASVASVATPGLSVDFTYDAPHLLTEASNSVTAVHTYDAPAMLSSPETVETYESGSHQGSRAMSRESSVVVLGFGVAAKTGTSLIGKSYGLGTVVENPGLAIKGFQGSKTPGHALNQIINRGISPSVLRDTVASPQVVLRQGSGNYLHLSDEAAVVMRPDGQVVTAYGRADFRQHIFDILADVG